MENKNKLNYRTFYPFKNESVYFNNKRKTYVLRTFFKERRVII